MQVVQQFEYDPPGGRPFPLATHTWGFVSRAYSNAPSDPHPAPRPFSRPSTRPALDSNARQDSKFRSSSQPRPRRLSPDTSSLPPSEASSLAQARTSLAAPSSLSTPLSLPRRNRNVSRLHVGRERPVGCRQPGSGTGAAGRRPRSSPSAQALASLQSRPRQVD